MGFDISVDFAPLNADLVSHACVKRANRVDDAIYSGCSTTIARMLVSYSLITMLVVTGDARHELLGLRAVPRLNFLEESGGIVATKGGGEAAVMQYLDISAFPNRVREAKVLFLKRIVGLFIHR